MINSIQDVADSEADITPDIDSVLAIVLDDKESFQRLEHMLHTRAICKINSHQNVEDRHAEAADFDGLAVESLSAALQASALDDCACGLFAYQRISDRA